MAQLTANITSASPVATGGILMGPLGTAYPTDASTALNAAIKPLGYTGREGLRPAGGAPSFNNIFAWGGDLVAAPMESRGTTEFEFDLLEVMNPEVAKLVFGAANVTVTPATTTAGTTISVQDTNWVIPRMVAVFDMLYGAKKLRFGDPMDPATELGTVVSARAAELFEKRVYMAEAAGAKVLYDPGRKGALLPPIVVDHVPHESELVMEETFGPIIPIVRVPDDDVQTMAISNSTAFGLSSGVCTNDFRRMQAYIRGLVVGTVNIWEVPGYRIEMSPFGGIKDSGNGYKEGVIEAMKSFTNVKTFSLPWG